MSVQPVLEYGPLNPESYGPTITAPRVFSLSTYPFLVIKLALIKYIADVVDVNFDKTRFECLFSLLT